MMQAQLGQTIKWSRRTVILIDIVLVLIPFLLLAGLEIYLRHTGDGLDERLFIPVDQPVERTAPTYQLNREL